MTTRKTSPSTPKSSRPAPRKPRTSRRPSRGRGRSSRGGNGGRWWALSVGALLSLALLAGLLWLFVHPLFWTAGQPIADLSDYNVHGIDISHHQRRVDWERLQRDSIHGFPLRFVIVKSTEGTNHRDTRFDEYFRQARRAHFIRGAYHFFRPGRDAGEQARFYLRNTPLRSGDLPAILDVEERGSKPLDEFQTDVLTWLRTVEEATGRPPILYTGVSFKQQYLRDERFDPYPLWVAHYNGRRAPRYHGRWVMWQYTESGRLSGVKGPVDQNVFNGKLQDLQALCLP